MTMHRFAASVALAILFCSGLVHAQAAPVKEPAAPAEQAQVPPEPSENDKRAKLLYTQADVAYSEGKYTLALALFRESYALSSRPLILIAMANTQERLGDLEGALANLRSYEGQVDTTNEPNIPQRILALEARVKEAAEKAEQDRLAKEEAMKPTGPVATVPVPVPVEPQTSAPSRKWPWILVGSGTAAVVAGATFALIASSARGKTDSLCSKAEGDLLCLPGAQKYLDRDSTFSVLADISVGLGVAAIATGVVFLVLPESEGPQTGPSIAVGQNSMSVSFEGSF